MASGMDGNERLIGHKFHFVPARFWVVDTDSSRVVANGEVSREPSHPEPAKLSNFPIGGYPTAIDVMHPQSVQRIPKVSTPPA